MSSMRAVEVTENGGPEVLRIGEREAARPGPGQVLVDVTAAGVNFMDIYARQGLPPYGGQTPFVLGAEGAGTVAEVGPGVDGLAPGDRVAWANVSGSYAEQVVVPADRAVTVPDGVELTTAAAVMLQGLTAHYLCHSTYPVRPGDRVVVHAGAGGVGLLLTQLVVLRGGEVVATTSTADKAELARGAGAARVAGYDDFPRVVDEVTGGKGVAAVYDGVGRTTFDASLSCLRPRGFMVLYGAASGPVPPVDPQRLNTGGSLYLTRPTLAHHIADRAELTGRADELFALIAAGKLDVRVGGTYPLEDAARAQEDLAARRTTGKLLLLPR
jgi:NADPH2:quinone reductase